MNYILLISTIVSIDQYSSVSTGSCFMQYSNICNRYTQNESLLVLQYKTPYISYRCLNIFCAESYTNSQFPRSIFWYGHLDCLTVYSSRIQLTKVTRNKVFACARTEYSFISVQRKSYVRNVLPSSWSFKCL